MKISVVAVVLAVVGVVLVASGLHGVQVSSAFRSVLAGRAAR